MQTSQGEQVYLNNCAECHGEHGEGGFEGSSLQGLPAGEDTIPGVIELVRDGVPDMDAFGGTLSEAEIQAVAEYVVMQFAMPGDIPTGGEIYRLDCAACHGATLHGGALIYSDRNAPELLDVSAAHIVSAIRAGPGTMPAFNEAAFSDEQAASVAAYVRTSQSPPKPGGLSLLYPGPVPEGFIAVVVGLGAAVLAALWVERGGRG